ncbi:MAG: hypothetical protein COW61_04265 [Candidatus Yonathbacteria bacterium CG17_big_fil_post_rev_8_21_14_2_50_46_19]|nr:MAG: hypothetical protein COW61_04265 [Candidatus Yonathbacteria bacterium CG17_big_fil_post_rev_8_21_14_2_50_46_19]
MYYISKKMKKTNFLVYILSPQSYNIASRIIERPEKSHKRSDLFYNNIYKRSDLFSTSNFIFI